MGKKHLFVIDPLERLDQDMDTSLALARALDQAGDETYSGELGALFWQASLGSASIGCRRLSFTGKPSQSDTETKSLDSFDSIHMRKDPPFDMRYIAATWLLGSVKSNVALFNEPSGIRDINEKVAILRYPEWSAPALVSSDPKQLLSFHEDTCNRDSIIKPLDLYSGHGIERLDETTTQDRFAELTDQGSQLRILQPFDKAIFDGEVRVFTIGASPLAWCKKIPAKGQFMANSSFGSSRVSHQPSAREEEAVRYVAKDLLQFGITIVGFDLIGGNISEINVTSPRLLAGEDDTTDYFSRFAEWVQSQC